MVSTSASDRHRILVADGDDYGRRSTTHQPHRPVHPRHLPRISTSSSSRQGRPGAEGRPDDPGTGRRAAARMGSPADDVIYSAMPSSTATPCRPPSFRPSPAEPPSPCGDVFRPRACWPTSGPCGATYFNTVGRAISHLVTTPPTANDGTTGSASSSDPNIGRRQGGVHRAVRGASSSRIRIQRERHRAPAGARRPAAARLGRSRDRDDVAVVDPDTGEERPRASSTPAAACPTPARPSASWWGGRRWPTSRATTTIPKPRPSAPATAGTGPATSATGTRRDLLLRRPHRRLAPGPQ